MYLESKNTDLKFNEIFIVSLFVSFGTMVSVILAGSAIAHAHSIPVTEIPAANSNFKRSSIASLLTITSPPSKMSSMAMMNVPGSSSSYTNMTGMPMTPIKNNTYIKETTMMNVNTKIEITPFNSGFNKFKVSFTDAQAKPYSKVSSVTMVFRNDQAGIGPIAANLNQTGPGMYTITGGYLGQTGQWDISMAAQRVNDYDLNYKLTLNVTAAPYATSSVTHTGNNNINSIQEAQPSKIDSFTYLAIGLAIAVGAFSMYSYNRSKYELRKTIQMLEPE